MGRTKSTLCSVCGEPRSEKAKVQALCEAHLKEYWRRQKSKRRPVKAAAPGLPPPVRPKVTVIGDRVTMDLATFQRLMAQPAQPPALSKPAGQRLAVVSADLRRALLVEATAGTVQELDDSQYAQQLMTLREAGYAVCVEG